MKDYIFSNDFSRNLDAMIYTCGYETCAPSHSYGPIVRSGYLIHYILGGKTGYTSLAGNTLVTCVEQNGVRLIAVVMKASGTHYTDTKAMLEDGAEDVSMTFVSKVPKKIKSKKEFYTNMVEVVLHDDGSYSCSDVMEDPDPDLDFTPPSKDEPRTKAFVLYEAPEHKQVSKPERHFIAAAPDDAWSAKRNAKGKKGRR